jgi:antitoxin CptB
MESPTRELLRWRCRRGMKELDLLLERFLQDHYAAVPRKHQQAFERLLSFPDPLLAEMLLGSSVGAPEAVGDAELAEVIALVAAPAPR